ncbi:MAG: phosphatase PAP2 family protein [Bacteroidetes bacterium]|nr:phosphatase PAP2 family protein [Bacteroidota bacterium]
MKKYRLLMIGLMLITKFYAIAQDDALAPKPLSSIPADERTLSIVPDKAYFKSWLTDGRDILIAPIKWNGYQWIAFSGVALVTAAIMTQDAEIQQIVLKNQNSFMDWASVNGLERLGSGVYSLPALAILYGVGAITKNDKARYTALKGVEAYIFGFVTAQVLKQLTHRHRPYDDDPPNPNLWDGPFAPISNSSFPSGHSTVIFAVATVIATSYNKTIWVPILCYTLAGLTAASRTYQNDHWLSDVFVGSALGFAIGRTIMNNHIKKLKILPVSHVGAGIMVVYQLN